MTGPRWRVEDGRLLFDGEPVVLLGGQLHNSTSSSVDGIIEGFRHVRALGGNTVIAPVCWDLLEPIEGEFDFTLVGRMLAEAHETDLRLVILWFGAFKNAASTYAPTWVRADQTRFPRARVEASIRQAFTYEGATHKPVLSVLSPELREADGRAFEALMTYLAGHALRARVAMVQVENEVGILADSRDRSDLANDAWSAPVPEEFAAFLRDAGAHSVAASVWRAAGGAASGSWADLLAEDWEADELFMAWAFGSYVEAIAARGAKIWPVPFYANAWLGPQPGQHHAGQYPSGGPGARVLDVWRAAAPTLAMLSPDIYVEDAASVLDAYAFAGNPLFVPENRIRAGDAVLALGRGALGWSAFGIDDVRPGGQLSELLALLASGEALIAAAQHEDRVTGIVLEPDQELAELDLGGFQIVARGTRALFERMLLDAGVPHLPPPAEPPGETIEGAHISAPHDTRPFALVVAETDDTFLVIGEGLTLDFFADEATVEIDSVVEGRFVDGEWIPGRALNGDERLQLLPVDAVGAVRIRLLRLGED